MLVVISYGTTTGSTIATSNGSTAGSTTGDTVQEGFRVGLEQYLTGTYHVLPMELSFNIHQR